MFCHSWSLGIDIVIRAISSSTECKHCYVAETFRATKHVLTWGLSRADLVRD